MQHMDGFKLQNNTLGRADITLDSNIYTHLKTIPSLLLYGGCGFASLSACTCISSSLVALPFVMLMIMLHVYSKGGV